MYSAPPAVGEMVAYVVPAYLLAGLRYPESENLDSFYIYIGECSASLFVYHCLIYHISGLMLLYLLCVRMLASSLAHAFSTRHFAAVGLGCVLLSQALVSGYLIHADDLPVWVSWIRYGTR